MKKSVLAFAAIATILTAPAAVASRDEFQTQIIQKAIKAKQMAQKNQQVQGTTNAQRVWWHHRLGVTVRG